MSPDPSGWSAVNLSAPQSLNRYAYALNNPLRLTDPTGLDPSDPSTCDDYQGVCSSEDAANQGLANGYGYNGEEPIILRNDDGSILTLQVGYRTGAPLHRQTHS